MSKLIRQPIGDTVSNNMLKIIFLKMSHLKKNSNIRNGMGKKRLGYYFLSFFYTLSCLLRYYCYFYSSCLQITLNWCNIIMKFQTVIEKLMSFSRMYKIARNLDYNKYAKYHNYLCKNTWKLVQYLNN